jgi:hypothetical protein
VPPFQEVYPVGVGYRPMGSVPTPGDYALWLRKVEDLLRTSRGRAALLHGGIIWRIAMLLGLRAVVMENDNKLVEAEEDSDPQYLLLCDEMGPSADATALPLEGGGVLVDDHLSLDDLDILCGSFTVFAGELFYWLFLFYSDMSIKRRKHLRTLD